MSGIRISLIVPSYNERVNLPGLLTRARAALEQVHLDFEILVVDDDSPDRCWEIAEQVGREDPRVRSLRRVGKRGLASAVVDGWAAARGDLLAVIDADLQHPPEILPQLLRPLIETDGAADPVDVVIASRYVRGGGVSEWTLRRRSISWTATHLARFAAHRALEGVSDPMSGYFAVRRTAVDGVRFRALGYKILLEVLCRGRVSVVLEVPYVFEERARGGSKLGPAQAWQFFKQLAWIQLDRLRGQ